MMNLRIGALVFTFLFGMCTAMNPLALVAHQPLWQAANPIPVNIDYAVPGFSSSEAINKLRDSSMIEYDLARHQNTFGKLHDAKFGQMGFVHGLQRNTEITSHVEKGLHEIASSV